MYYSPKYRANQILGKPNILPNGAETPCAWTPSGQNLGSDWVAVGFAEPIKIKQVAICENVNPGSISQILAINKEGEEILIYTNEESTLKETGRIWNVIIPIT